ncbi:MAG TPA: hypothetical protein ENK11_07620 [Phycisphaerales bacterium]|nr:hypothetical protein [Phycisphaerales bacterium]
MNDDPNNPMRKLGRWAGRIRAGFKAGLRGESSPHPAPEVHGPPSSDGPAAPATGKRVIARRTTIEEIEIRDPECR